jgi:hypothetical protein
MPDRSLELPKPDQALTLVLTAVPDGWTAQVLPTVRQRRLLREVKLKPSEVYKLPE